LKNNGLSDGSLRTISYILKELSRHCNLDVPESVKEFIANKKCSNSFKIQMVKAYNYYVVLNGIEWIKPHYRCERKIPKIPTKENIMKIVSASRKYAVIFKVLMETGIMPYELSRVSKSDIDFDRGLLTVQGFKGHNSRVFKLSDETIAMLKLYFSKYQSFPEAIWIKKMWIKTRNKVSFKLNEPQLRSIRLYDLRHYYATMLYAKTKDILYVMKQLGHKKLDTTLIYTQLVNFPNEEYYCAIARNVDEAKNLIECGFEYVTEFNGVKLFRKRK
jgi:integrase